MAAAGWLLVVAATALAATASAHDGHETDGLEEQLVDDVGGVMIGRFDAPQAGPLVVVPFTNGPLPCGVSASTDLLVPVGNGTAASFAANATHVQVLLDVPVNATGYIAAALDTADAHRTIMMMMEHAIAIHALGSILVQDDDNQTANVTFRKGVMGVSYRLPGAEEGSAVSKYFEGHPMPGEGIRMQYDLRAPVTWCRNEEQGAYGVLFERASMTDSLGDGMIVHGVVMWDHDLPAWLPRPIDTTDELQVNLYLARPGERPEALQAALGPGPTLQTLISVGCLLAAGLWTAGRFGR